MPVVVELPPRQQTEPGHTDLSSKAMSSSTDPTGVIGWGSGGGGVGDINS